MRIVSWKRIKKICYFIFIIQYDDGILYLYDDGIFTEVEILQDYF